jgi:phage shock protein PspC (stress-responsive transcriptional regulator)
MLSGVCEGIGAFLHIDATIIRIIFAILTVLTHGLFILFYIVLALIIPSANTPEERAAAKGKRFSAQDVIDEAKKTYQGFRNNTEWKTKWNRQKLEWQRMWRRGTGRWSQNTHRSASYTGQIVGAMIFPMLFILSISLSLLMVWVIFAFLGNGTLFGMPFLPQGPGLVELMLILLFIALITAPIRAARRASYRAAGFSHAERGVLTIVWLGLVATGAWFAYQSIPEVHYIINNLHDILIGIFS